MECLSCFLFTQKTTNMKTHEEKAIELVEKYYKYANSGSEPTNEYHLYSAKQCALIHVDGIHEHRSEDLNNPDITPDEIESIGLMLNELRAVREAITKL